MINTLLLKFAILVPVSLIIYYLLPHRLQNYWLLFISYLFYTTWLWMFPLLLILLSLSNFVLGQEIKAAVRHKRPLLILGIALNILLIVLLKYFIQMSQFLPATLLSVGALSLRTIGINVQSHLISILLPIGLSFRMLEAISYLTDIYNGRTEPVTDLIDCLLYFAYFPKLISGPIERVHSFLPKLQTERQVDNTAVAESTALILVGLIRKIVLADSLLRLISITPEIRPQDQTSATLVVWLVSLGIGLYNDFAGYTSIVRGISGLFGIGLSPNFQQPYLARNFTEFWGRWHISFSQWLRDYIYFPVSRALAARTPNRRHLVHLIIPPLVTMMVSALWHALTPALLVWGLLYALYMILWRAPSWLCSKPLSPPGIQPRWRQAAGTITVFVLVMWAWVPFWLPLPAAFGYWRAMLNWAGSSVPIDPRLIMLIFGSFILDLIQQKGEIVFVHWPLPVRASAIAFTLLLLAAFIGFSQSTTQFIYQGF